MSCIKNGFVAIENGIIAEARYVGKIKITTRTKTETDLEKVKEAFQTMYDVSTRSKDYIVTSVKRSCSAVNFYKSYCTKKY
ncbi:MAG: hypothetical protein N2171_08205 [Clostridia bacterium]|nr:hypothetical protein [Clostridia bacterium]